MLKESIAKIVEELVDKINEGVSENIETDSVDEYHSFTYTTYDVGEDVKDFLLSLGKIINNDELVKIYTKPKSITQIVKELNENNLFHFDELEEVDSFSDSDSEPKYVYRTHIMKYIPTGTLHSFTIQETGDVNVGIEYEGRVEQKEVIIRRWEIVPD